MLFRSRPVNVCSSLPVLVVDDSDVFRLFVSNILSAAGYKVIEASDGEKALERASRTGRLGALVTDVLMPNRNGHSLAGELRERQSDLPVIFFSGNAVSHEAAGPRDTMLIKPISPAALLQAVSARVLNE